MLTQLIEFYTETLHPDFFKKNKVVKVPLRTENQPKDLILIEKFYSVPPNQAENSLFFVDFINIIEETKYWLDYFYGSNEKYRKLIVNDPLLEINLVTRFTVNDHYISEEKAWQEFKDVQQKAEQLLIILNELVAKQTTGAENFTSAEPIIKAINDNPVESWDLIALPVVSNLQQTPLYSQAVVVTLPSLNLNSANIRVPEIRKVLNTFTQDISREARTLEAKIPPKLFTKITEDIDLLLYPDEGIGVGGVVLGDPAQKSTTDDDLSQEFKKFFTELIPYLVGNQVYNPEKEEGDAASDGAEGDANEPEEKPKISDLKSQSPQELVNLIYQQAVQKAYQELHFEEQLGEFVVFSPDLINSIAKILLIFCKSDTRIWDELNKLILEHPEIYDPGQGLIIVNETTQELVANFIYEQIELSASATVSEVNKINNPLETIVTQAQISLGLKEKGESDDLKPTEATSWVPIELASYIDQQPVGQKPGEGQSFFDWWLGLSIQDRLKYVRGAGLLGVQDSTLDSLAKDYLRQYFAEQAKHAFDKNFYRFIEPEELNNLAYQNPQLFNSVKEQLRQIIFESPEINSLTLLTPQGRIFFWQNYQQLIKEKLKDGVQPQINSLLQLYITKHAAELKQQGFQIYGIDGANTVNFNEAVDALLFLSRDPHHFIDQLTPDKCGQYFRIIFDNDSTVAERQIQEFKKFLHQITAYRLQEIGADGLLENDDEVDGELGRAKSLVRALGTENLVEIFQLPVEEFIQAQEAEFEAQQQFLQEEERREAAKNYQQRIAFQNAAINKYWSDLDKEQRASLSEHYGEGEDDSQAPSRLSIAGSMALLSGRPTAISKNSWRNRLPNFLGGQKKPQTLGKKALNSASTAATKILVSGIANISDRFFWGSGALIQFANKFGEVVSEITGIDYKKIIAGMAGLLAGFFGATTYAFLSSWPAFIAGTAGAIAGAAVGGISGFLTGGIPGAIAGAGSGSLAGWISGTWGGYSAFHDTPLGQNGPLDLMKSTGGGGSSTTTAATRAALPQTIFGAPAIPVMITSGATVAAVTTQIMTAGTFINPLPTLNQDNFISRYVSINKVASPGNKLEEPADITYTITISADRGYDITITDFSDVLTVKYNSQEKPAGANDHEISTKHIGDLIPAGNSTPLALPIILSAGESIVFQGYTEHFDGSFQNSNVTNTVNISFTTPESLSETAKSAEVVCFGKCPQRQGGCWPASGWMQQTTANELHTHNVVQAVDIRNTIGTNIYMTYNSSTRFNVAGTGIGPVYGNHAVAVVAGDSTGSNNTIKTGFQLLYGHMNNFTEQAYPGNSNLVNLVPGQQIGQMGISGLNVLGPSYAVAGNSHLHYEMRTTGGNIYINQAGLRLEDAIPENEMVLGEFVRTCYE
jgi:hypothetical protein